MSPFAFPPRAAARSLLPGLLLSLVLALPAAAEPQTTPAVPTLEGLSWLAGSWKGQAGPWTQEEHWTAPAAGLMLGLHRDAREDGRVAFEYLRIEEREDGIFYLASPGGREATAFRLIELTANRALFTNPEHDFPTRIVYERDGDSLKAWALGDDGKGLAFAWTRSSLTGD